MRLYTGRLAGALPLKLGLALGVVALGDLLFVWHEPGGLTLGVFLVGVLTALMAARPAVRRDPRALGACAAALAMALAMAWNPSPIAFLLFWIAAGMATLLPRTARFDDGWRWFQRLFALGLFAIPAPLIDRGRAARAVRERGRKGVGAMGLLRLVALPIAGSAVVVVLFATANPVVERILDGLRVPMPDDGTTLRVVFWCVLFTAIWGLLRPRLPLFLVSLADHERGDARAVPGVSTGSVLLSLAAFNLLFAAQNAMDAAWLWGLAPLPEGLTLADYAHRGAYPLIATALFAALFVLACLRPGSDTARVPAIRRLVTLWIAQNLFLVASSALRTIDYIEAYSLTRLRIAALLWMGLVALGLVLVLWRLLRDRSAAWLINANLAAAGLLLGVTSFADLGATAAWWNIAHARQIDGDGAGLDLYYIETMGASSLLPLVALETGSAGDEALRYCARQSRRAVMARVEAEIRASGGSLVGRWRLREARRTLGFAHPAPAVAVPLDMMDCGGGD